MIPSYVSNVNLPTIHVASPGNNFWEEMTYIPVLSNIKGSVDILVGIAFVIHGLAIGIFYQGQGRAIEGAILQFFSGINSIVIGLLESIPVVGNLALGFATDRIRVIPPTRHLVG